MSCWLHFLVIGMDRSWARRRWYLMGGGEASCLQDCLHGFLQEDPWTCESLLLWCTELWFCLPCSLLSRSWTPPSHGHHSQSCPQTFTVPTSSSFFVSIISNKARPLYLYPAPYLYHSIVQDLSHHISVIPAVSALHLHAEVQFLLCVSHAVCISVQALQRSTQSCWKQQEVPPMLFS